MPQNILDATHRRVRLGFSVFIILIHLFGGTYDNAVLSLLFPCGGIRSKDRVNRRPPPFACSLVEELGGLLERSLLRSTLCDTCAHLYSVLFLLEEFMHRVASI